MSQTKAQLVDAVDGSIVAADLASNCVTTAKVADDAITMAKLSTTGTASQFYIFKRRWCICSSWWWKNSPSKTNKINFCCLNNWSYQLLKYIWFFSRYYSCINK